MLPDIYLCLSDDYVYGKNVMIKKITPLIISFLALFVVVGMGFNKSKDLKKIKVLIIDGRNNHNWKDTTPFLKAQLEGTGKFLVSVATTPPNGAKSEDWSNFNPNFSKCDVVLSNYNGAKWEPASVREAFEKFLNDGGALVNVHAANNAHKGWLGFEDATGLLWRGNKDGARLYLDKVGQLMKVDVGKGRGAGHGPQHEYLVKIRDEEHPITKGIPKEWLHGKDELYHGQRGPAKNMKILATAFSDSKKGGTGVHEPMLWTIPVGKGVAVTNVLGHVGGNAKNMPAMKCVGFLTLVSRSCEWAVTGNVTIPVPSNFPNLSAVSLVK
jgi:hypothetical protein